MFFKKNKKTNTILGVDFSLNETRVVELEKIQEGDYNYQILNFVKIDMPVGSFFEDKIETNIFGELLKEVAENNKLKNKLSVSAVSSSSTLTKQFTVPIDANEKEIEGMIRNSSKTHTPKGIESMSFDFYEDEDQRTDELKTIIIKMCPLESISSREDTLNMAEIDPSIIETDELALLRMHPTFSSHYFLETGEKLEDSFILLVDVNDSKIKIHSLNGEKISSMNEKYIRKDLNHDKTDDFKSILSHIKETLFLSETNNEKIQAVFLTGNNNLLIPLKSFLEDHLDIDLIIANPFLNIKYAGVNIEEIVEAAPSLVLACGLAMRNINNERY